MKKLAILSIFCILFSVSCAFQKGPTHYDEDYEIWFEKNATNGLIKFESSPEKVLVYIIGEEDEEIIGTTPTSYKVKATGKPYYFRLVKERYYDYRVTVRPTAENPIVEVNVELDKIINEVESIETPESTETKEMKSKKYDDRIVGESSESVEAKTESRFN